MTSIPKKLKIGALTVPVSLVTADDIDGSFGMFSTKNQNIRICKEVVEAQRGATLLHEALHAMFWDAGLNTKFNKDDEEILVRVLEGRLLAFLKDNPKAVEYIVETLK